jgi:hypothetical protein
MAAMTNNTKNFFDVLSSERISTQSPKCCTRHRLIGKLYRTRRHCEVVAGYILILISRNSQFLPHYTGGLCISIRSASFDASCFINLLAISMASYARFQCHYDACMQRCPVTLFTVTDTAVFSWLTDLRIGLRQKNHK